ncbi:putative selenate reductase subunit YgfK [Peptoniphilus equinus]|uniref:dihydrouracil dehydrogenase (NAD(+)) n=1 Tax=Peptoniphilus equinus TaxID=3016343 RepID=A0ABY7QXB3_9FIRM|nr:putative selenate reductase subunit YgfK [Peptoniphilus equinus]WBW50578.1 putative selenate reductase subunit YgfK [Peptoniphilus equinus]
MSEFMRSIPFDKLIEWSLNEYKNEGKIFGVRKENFYKNKSGKMLTTIFGDTIASAVGPAAGPQSQLAQNLVASYLAGARFMEIKTVQVLDGEDIQKAIARPCIAAEDECYNCEWSTELTVEQAFIEYTKGFFAIQVLAKELGLADKKDFAYNMSVGYDLEGIQSKKIDTYIESLRNAENTDIYKECKAYLRDHLDQFEHFTQADLDAIPTTVCNSITLSTLHGCPAAEIESIATYLLDEKKISTFIKCNPTMLGYDYARKTLDSMGFDYISFTDHHFNNDLQYADAVVMIERLLALAKKNGLAFGVKLTNTFPVDVKRNELPSEEMYMSGRSLLPLSLSMAAMLSEKFEGKLPMSYSGGADATNIRDIFEALGQPITVATTILKPGGYARFNQLAELTEDLLDRPYRGVDVEKILALRDRVIGEWKNNKLYREKVASRKTDSALPLTDCYKAPCKDGGCPIEQQIPEYLKLVSEERYDEAMKVIGNDNTAPTILGMICAHHCQEHCTRVDYEKTLQIRDMKLVAAKHAQEKFVSAIKPSDLVSDKKVLVIGAGPGGIAAASYLRRNGVDVTVYEKLAKPYGIVSHIIPEFRIPDEDIQKDYLIAVNQGVKFVFNREVTEKYDDLKKDFDYVIVATGAWAPGLSPVKEGQEKIVDALDFLWHIRMEDGLDLGKTVAVVGAGDVAMDCTRLAARQPGVEKVTLVYRRTESYMPATQEEVNDVKAEGHEILELTAPYKYDGKILSCEKMMLSDFDASGRRSVKGTGEMLELEFDTVIGATGARVDTTAFAENGVNMDERGRLKLLPTMESNLENVYFIGDCKAGPSTIVKAMGDAKRVALDILAKENLDNDFERFTFEADVDDIYAKRGIIVEKLEGHKEGSRCLKCDQICEICTEVCPNRANVAIAVQGYDNLHQIIHIDGMCNECGNCGVFCPHAGEPYKDKLTIFWTDEDFEDSTNVGFIKISEDTYRVRMENGNVVETKLNEGRLSDNLVRFITAIEEDYPHYVSPTYKVF